MSEPKYDAVFKSILKSLASRLTPSITGSEPVETLNTEFPEFRSRYVDLLMRLADGSLLHLELQTKNDPSMHYRMLHYWLLVRQNYDQRRLRQVVLYVGNAALCMPRGIQNDRLAYQYEMIDIREIDSEVLLASPQPGDRVLAVLCGNPDPARTIRRIIESFAGVPHHSIGGLSKMLVLLSGLRDLKNLVREEIDRMAIDFEELKRENPWYQEWKEEGLAEGRAEGRVAGRAEGLHEGERKVLTTVLRRRFGTLPKWVLDRLETATCTDLDAWAERVLDAPDLTSIFS